MCSLARYDHHEVASVASARALLLFLVSEHGVTSEGLRYREKEREDIGRKREDIERKREDIGRERGGRRA